MSRRSTVARALPNLDTLIHYDRRWLREDTIAGVTVSAYLIPQVMGYSQVAGLPAFRGSVGDHGIAHGVRDRRVLATAVRWAGVNDGADDRFSHRIHGCRRSRALRGARVGAGVDRRSNRDCVVGGASGVPGRPALETRAGRLHGGRRVRHDRQPVGQDHRHSCRRPIDHRRSPVIHSERRSNQLADIDPGRNNARVLLHRWVDTAARSFDRCRAVRARSCSVFTRRSRCRRDRRDPERAANSALASGIGRRSRHTDLPCYRHRGGRVLGQHADGPLLRGPSSPGCRRQSGVARPGRRECRRRPPARLPCEQQRQPDRGRRFRGEQDPTALALCCRCCRLDTSLCRLSPRAVPGRGPWRDRDLCRVAPDRCRRVQAAVRASSAPSSRSRSSL